MCIYIYIYSFMMFSCLEVEVCSLVDRLATSFKAPAAERGRRERLRGRWRLIYSSSPDLTSLDSLPLGWRTGRVGQAFVTSRFARNEIDFLSPLCLEAAHLGIRTEEHTGDAERELHLEDTGAIGGCEDM